MKVYELRTRVRLPRPRPEVFALFADAGNLEAITPPWLHSTSRRPFGGLANRLLVARVFAPLGKTVP
jgi:hypothetical protein